MAVALLGGLPLAAAVSGPAVATPAAPLAPRAASAFDLDLVTGTGTVTIKGGAPLPLAQPTGLTGQVDPGAGTISGGTFSTPPISFTQDITSPITARVYITATFSEAEPGTAVGTVDGAGNVAVSDVMDVDLAIEVGRNPTLATGDCRASGVRLDLASTSAYDRETGRVRLADPDFTVPPIEASATCPALLVGPINTQLSGSGNALALTLEGPLELPPPPGEASTTTLAVSPEGGADLGAPVALTATVTGTAGGPTPTGAVSFRDGGREVAAATLVDGEATASTSTLPVGGRSLTAVYQGDATYEASTSSTTAYRIAAVPTVAGDLPEHVTIGAAPVEFDLVTANPAAGRALANARVDISVTRPSAIGAPPITAAQLLLEHQLADGTWEAVALTGTSSLAGSIGPATGAPLAAGASATSRVRIAAPAGAPTGLLEVTTTLVVVDPATGATTATVDTSTGRTTLVPPTRLPSSVEAYTYSGASTRPGYVDILQGGVTPSDATGTYVVRLDGRPIQTRAGSTPNGPLTATRALSGAATLDALVAFPAELAAGPHLLTVEYSGDAVYRPSVSAPVTVQVQPGLGTLMTCTLAELDVHFGAYLQAQADLPTSRAAGTTIPLGQLEVSVLSDAGPSWASLGDLPDMEPPSLVVGPGGSASAAGATFHAPEGTETDVRLDLTDPVGSFRLEGAPGTVVPVTLDQLVIRAGSVFVGLKQTVTCQAVGEPLVLGQVTVAGTTLAVSPASPVRAGSEVALTATVAPAGAAGVVDFLDGDDVVGTARVVDGTASIVTTDLAVGTRSLVARFNGGISAPSTRSAPTSFTVLPPPRCAAQAVAGDGAVVRGVYLELLDRCPSPEDQAHWTGRLATGDPTSLLAAYVALAPEAEAVMIDDAYRTVLGRASTASGRAHWVGRLGRLAPDPELRANLAASDEFRRRSGGSDAGFVDRAFTTLVGRPPSAAERRAWLTRLGSGWTRLTVARNLAGSLEGRRAIVGEAYADVLDRAPTGAERDTAATALLRDGSRLGLYHRLVSTPGFRVRAQGFPD